MAAMILLRVLVTVAVALVASCASYLLIHSAGDVAAAIAGEGASRADIEIIRARHGLDQPILLQYLSWLKHALSGDLGASLHYNRPVAALVAEHLPPTLYIGGFGILFAVSVSVPLGAIAALNRGRLLDKIAVSLSVVGQAVPPFWLALMLIYLFAVKLSLLPATTTGEWDGYVMPILVLGLTSVPALVRMARAGMIETLSSDYIRTARSKGLSDRRVLFVHALPNGLAPVVALSAVQFGAILAGGIIVEVIFAVKGLGYLTWFAITASDYAVVQAIVVIMVVIYAVMSLLSDLLNMLLDPRIRRMAR